MPTRALSVGGLLAASLAGCDPLYVITVRQPLQPVPARSCVQSALEASPLVESVTRLSDAGLNVILRDSAPDRTLQATIAQEMRDSGLVLSVRYQWLGTANGPSAAHQQRMVDVATQVLGAVRSACAPTAPAMVECVTSGLGRPRVCRTGR